MAFTTRSRRLLSKYSTQTDDKVGPGSYLSNKSSFSNRYKYSSAPFSKTETRFIKSKEDNQSTPGPGSYYLKDPMYIDEYSQYLPTSSSIFKSKSSRFRDNSSHVTPGPGNYNTEKNMWTSRSNINRVTNTMNSRSSREAEDKKEGIVWVRVNTVPSIPTKSCGYEESEKGELVKQDAKQNRYDGTKKSSTGPGEYYKNYLPFDSTRNKYAGASIFKSKTRRNFIKSNPTPGPGAYDVNGRRDKLVELPDPYSKSSCFASSTRRMNWTKDDESTQKMPGPGSYLTQYTNSNFVMRSKPSRFQNFGSSSIRNTLLVKKSLFGNYTTPGPGHFIKDTSTLDQGIKKNTKSHGPFQTTQKRFRHRTRSTPGPGSYDFGKKSKSLAQKKKKVRGVFGTTTKRFEYVEGKDYTPGVGNYSPKVVDDMDVMKKKNHMSYNFCSRTKRSQSYGSTSENTPGPGSYSDNLKWVKKTSEKKSKGAKRFVETTNKKDNNPGPGAYKHEDGFRKKKSKSAIVKRRKGKKNKIVKWYMKAENPGPGSYVVDNEWTKKSYNITLY